MKNENKCCWCMKEQGIPPDENTGGICEKHKEIELHRFREWMRSEEEKTEPVVKYNGATYDMIENLMMFNPIGKNK